MPDFRVHDTAPDHPKFRAAGLAAVGLWTAAGSFSMRTLADGWVPSWYVSTWHRGRHFASRLVAAGLWFEESLNGEPGYRFHDWHDYQRPAETFLEERKRARERAAKSRRTRAARAENVRDSHDERAEAPSPSPSPSPRDGDLGGERPVPNGHALRDGPPRCPRHVNDPDPPPCGQCAEARRTAERTAADGVLAELAARSAFRAAVDACDRCDEFGMREIGDAVARCDHTAAEVS